jgi:hypothetical protein
MLSPPTEHLRKHVLPPAGELLLHLVEEVARRDPSDECAEIEERDPRGPGILESELRTALLLRVGGLWGRGRLGSFSILCLLQVSPIVEMILSDTGHVDATSFLNE